MIRSLYTGISGLRNHQVKMDVTSHNIANVNTFGYKSQRVTLKEGFTQMLRGASRPAGNAGGVNPMQLGLGMSIGSIDSVMEQGGMQTTGKLTDLAIEGNAFFAFTNGMGGTYYGRNGALMLNSNGTLVAGNNGYALLGLTADSEGKIPPTAVAGPIRIPFGDKSPARATEEVQLGCNLDSDSVGLGTWTHTATFLTEARGNTAAPGNPSNSDLLTGLFNGDGNSLNIQDKDKLKISFREGADNHAFTFVVDTRETASDNPTATPPTIKTLDGLRQAIQIALNDASLISPGGAVAINPDGTLSISGANASITNLVVNNETRPNSNSYVASLFQWPGAVCSATSPIGVSIGRTLAAVNVNTPLLGTPSYTPPGGSTPITVGGTYDANGKPLSLFAGTTTPPVPGDPIKLNATIGKSTLQEDPNGLVVGTTWNAATAAWVPGNTTMGDLIIYMQQRLRLPDSVPNPDGNEIASIEINTPPKNDTRAPVGSLIIRGMPGKAFEISGLSIRAENSNHRADDPTPFNSNMIGTDFQLARDVTVHGTSLEVFDETGAPHTLTMIFTHSGTPGKWLWELRTADGEPIIGGNRGTVTFAEDGSPTAWMFDDGSSTFRFNPNNGAAALSIRLDTGKFGTFTGITQFRSATTTALKGQDGYPMGKLNEITISEQGEISGLFSNGQSRNLAVILLAEFHNPAGLYRSGDTMWAESNNSGEGVLQRPGEGTTSVIKPGALEMSNVDLASEFTDLITTQRGYQANARVISTSDNLLQELVQLVR